jgi:cytochrome P450
MMSSYEPLIEESVASFLESVSEEEDYVAMVPKMRAFFMFIVSQAVLGTQNVSEDLIGDTEIWARGLLAPPLTFLP